MSWGVENNMSFKNSTFKSRKKLKPKIKIEIEMGYEAFVPEEFRQNPIGYFESKGKNIKEGEARRDKTGRAREDPAAVKELPAWTDNSGNKLKIIGKMINIEKGEIGKSGDPFYEYKVIKIINEVGLPASKTVAKAQQGDTYLIIMEKVSGIGWYEKEALELKAKGYSEEDIKNLKKQAEEQTEELRKKFDKAGIKRSWKLKDMIFDIDIDNKRIRKIIPTDWERTKIDIEKLQAYKQKISRELLR